MATRMFTIDPRQQGQRQYEVLFAKHFVERVNTIAAGLGGSPADHEVATHVAKMRHALDRPTDKWRSQLAVLVRAALTIIGTRVLPGRSDLTWKTWPEALKDEARSACIQLDS